MSTFMCKKCSTEYPVEHEANYCKMCGAPLKNICLNPNCKKVAPFDAAYCEECGNKTSYNEAGFVKEPCPF